MTSRRTPDPVGPVVDGDHAAASELLCAKCGAPHSKASRYCRVCGHAHGDQVAGQLVVQGSAAIEATAATPGLTPKHRPAAQHAPAENWAILVDERSGMLQLPAELTAERTFSPGQVRVFAITGLIILAAMFVQPVATMTILVTLATIIYLSSMGYRMKAYFDALRAPAEIRIGDDEARSIPDAALPIYTVLVPAYKEPEVIARLLASIDALEYPRDKLDVKLLLEMDDQETYDVARQVVTGDHIEIIRVPPSLPRTKPKACNYGLTRALEASS